MSTEVFYGDPSNIDVFATQKLNDERILSSEPYADELLKVYENHSTFDFDSSSWTAEIGEPISGTVSSISADKIIIDTQGKEFITVSLEKEKVSAEDFNIGDEVDVLLTDNKNGLKGSFLEYTKYLLYSDMKDNEDKVYEAKVVSLTENGYILDIDGLQVFMPGSLGGINRLVNFEVLLGKTINVVKVKNDNDHSKFKNQLIVSHKDYLRQHIPIEVAKLEYGEVYSGKVTGTTDFGVFLEFAATPDGPVVLTGLIHKDLFDEVLGEQFKEGKVEPGREIDFYFKEALPDKKLVYRLILSRQIPGEENVIVSDIKKDDIVQGKITRVMKYGAFVKLDRYASGLLHINKIGDEHNLKKGDKIDVKVLDINDDKYDLDLA